MNDHPTREIRTVRPVREDTLMRPTTTDHRARLLRPIGCAIAVFALISSCATVNELQQFDFRGRSLGLVAVAAPAPTVRTRYDVNVDLNRPVETFINVGTNLAKANEAADAEKKLRAALSNVNIPQLIADAVYRDAVSTLGTRATTGGTVPSDGDVVLRIETRHYGIEASSYGEVSFVISVDARLYTSAQSPNHGRLLWERSIERRDRLSPSVFGLGGAVGNVVTISVLDTLTDQQIVDGLNRLAGSTARAIGDRLNRDFYR